MKSNNEKITRKKEASKMRQMIEKQATKKETTKNNEKITSKKQVTNGKIKSNE